MEVHMDTDGDVIVVVVGTNWNIVGVSSKKKKKKGKRKKGRRESLVDIVARRRVRRRLGASFITSTSFPGVDSTTSSPRDRVVRSSLLCASRPRATVGPSTRSGVKMQNWAKVFLKHPETLQSSMISSTMIQLSDLISRLTYLESM